MASQMAYLVALFSFSISGDAPEIIDLQKIHAQWKYDGPVFPEIPEIEKLNNATRYLLALLVNQNADYENINERFETFVSLMKYGFSKEGRKIR